jgi:hypothetical protein
MGGYRMKKDTSKLLEELTLCADFSTFYNENQDQLLRDTLSQLLERFVKEKGLKKSVVFRNAELSEIYGYQIFAGKRMPERKKLLCLAIGMGLTLEETQSLLKSAGYPLLYAKHPFDCVVVYGICKQLSVVDINAMLFEYELETLG